MNDIRLLEQGFLRDDIPDFRPGDTVRVHVRVMEAGRERIQVFEGVVIGRSGGGLQETFTVRKISFGVGVERIFPVHAPIVSRIEVLRKGLVRRGEAELPAGPVGQIGPDQRETRLTERPPEGTLPVPVADLGEESSAHNGVQAAPLRPQTSDQVSGGGDGHPAVGSSRPGSVDQILDHPAF